MAFNQTFPSISTPVINKNGTMTIDFRYLLVNLWQRTGGGPGADIATVQAEAEAAQTTANTAVAQAAASLKKAANLSDVVSVPQARIHLGLTTQAGWAAPTGTVARTTFNADQTTVFSALYDQTQGQAVNDQLVIIQKRLAALIDDLTTLGLIGA